MLNEAVEYLIKHLETENIVAAIVLGSGLTFSESELTDTKIVNTSDIPGYPVSTVIGHKGTITTGIFESKRIMILAGRVHYYEGYNYDEVVFPVELVHAVGVNKFIMTNASGGISSELKQGSIVIINNFISPFSKVYRGDYFDIVSEELSEELYKAGIFTGADISKGTYAYMTGPSFETPAEINYLSRRGGDVVGMSTLPEAVKAQELGMEVAAISRVANLAAGISGEILSHTEVLEAAKDTTGIFKTFIHECLRRL